MLNKIREFLIKHYIATTALVAVIVVLGFYFFKFHYQLSNDNGNWGTFGDFFGGTLNPILSFLALMVLLRTFSMQREELDLQREELKDTKAILKEQSETQKRQQFEGTFFELLKVHNEALEPLSEYITSEKLNDIYKMMNMRVISGSGDEKNKVIGIRIKIKEEHNHVVGRYFRVLHQLLKFIAIHEPNTTVKDFNSDELKKEVNESEQTYTNIVRALLPDELIKLLVVNCWREHHEGSYYLFRLLIERYAFFQNHLFETTDENSILFRSWDFYNEKAFGTIERPLKSSQNQENQETT